MGAVQQSESQFTYLRVTKGKMVNKKKAIEWGGYTGYLVGLSIKEDTYEGKPTRQVEVKMKDDKTDEVVVIQFTRDAWYALGFFARIFKIDIKKPFTLGVSGSDDNEKISWCYMKQEGISYTNKDGKVIQAVQKHDKHPVPVDVDLGGGQKAKSWAEPIKYMERIMAGMVALIEKEGIKLPTAPPATAVVEAPAPATANAPSAYDDLPF